jgi:hypothetical protein
MASNHKSKFHAIYRIFTLTLHKPSVQKRYANLKRFEVKFYATLGFTEFPISALADVLSLI